VLIATFLGIGLGILLGRRRPRLPVSPFALILFGLVAVVQGVQLNIQVQPGDQIFYGLEFNHSADTNFLVLPLLMVAVVALMATLALPLGGLLRSRPPRGRASVAISATTATIRSGSTRKFVSALWLNSRP